ncbi:hypothetical protein B0T19DRAFT_218236 [Cercophora scortea]|uniref:Uncharacterized protein n=1 Tax=Cercophora scortea TaxID=314031 RepID=A0AAE0MAI7_9PEZI|nr:hypothetical protein B0T19DRAFT_218236 [Cercophora scortea]
MYHLLPTYTWPRSRRYLTVASIPSSPKASFVCSASSAEYSRPSRAPFQPRPSRHPSLPSIVGWFRGAPPSTIHTIRHPGSRPSLSVLPTGYLTLNLPCRQVVRLSHRSPFLSHLPLSPATRVSSPTQGTDRTRNDSPRGGNGIGSFPAQAAALHGRAAPGNFGILKITSMTSSTNVYFRHPLVRPHVWHVCSRDLVSFFSLIAGAAS